ncbi:MULTISPECIES: F420-nonreducing hydrogenase [Methanobacterium]|jgi:F420-non-reducing hydrogenase small subunit|uniref:F420-nonreducing hydrogenase n=1 Tax=Methanobacterium veterum TaxID=408577 RepID=A0A9E5DKH2_9EURY|nr:MULTISPECIES: F420-nonreducing hydrogenase [Methanobacterium]MCZ3364770.1 F420-nonreducing hydrogenase [Methanobacterium veterum]MCZ3372524.1 F420-nonreducing hydrogenase [Methanobacterium veterum]
MVKIALEWLAGCAGCEISILDLHEGIMELLKEADIVYAPVLMDTKEVPDDIDIAIVSGSVRNKENKERLEELRKKSKTLIAYGTCACYGGITGMADLYRPEDVTARIYSDNPSTEAADVPSEVVPELLPIVHPAGDFTEIDYFLPGCPPKELLVWDILMPLIKGETPDVPKKSVCADCSRWMDHVEFDKLNRRIEGDPDPQKCFLSQGYVCLGSVTLGRCGALCTSAGIPCHGCGGPSLDVLREPSHDVYNGVIKRIAHLSKMPEKDVEKQIRDIGHVIYGFVIGSTIMEDKQVSLIPQLVKK